jgi:N-acetylglucosamine-6-phosphate deacetylase
VTRSVLRGRAFVRGEFHDDCVITIENQTIADVIIGASSAESHAVDGVILPGFVDVHVHGGGGADFMDGTRQAVETVTTFHARHGTAALAATTLSAPRDDITRAIRCVADGQKRSPAEASEIAGIHLEGPYLNPKRSGAQDRGSIRQADMHELQEWLRLAPKLRWIMTVAPEMEGALPLLEKFRRDVVFSLGHTEATLAEAIRAVQLGARHYTHLFNAMPPLHHREPGVIGAALISPECTVEMIADGIHVHPVLLQTFVRMMPDRVVLVTDAMRAAGLSDGTYKLHEYDVIVADGAARLTNGALAGSTLTMIRAVQNMVELAGLPLQQVIPLATENPARLLQIEMRKGKIEIGYDADLVVISPRFEIRRVFLRGQEIKQA